MPKQIVVSGSVAVDRLLRFDGKFSTMIKPSMLEVLSISILMDSSEIVRGGVGANIVTGAANLNMNPILLGSVGSDAKDYIHHLHESGVDTTYVHYSKAQTATFTVFTDKDNNQIGGFYPGAMADSSALTFKEWRDADVLAVVSANDPATMQRLVKECANYDMSLFYDPGQQVNNIEGTDILEGCKAAELVMANEYELGVMSEKTNKTISDLKAMSNLFITTLGAEGCEISGKTITEPIKVPAMKVDDVLDPTGAGDAFRAGFLYGYVNQWDATKSCQLGTTMASLTIESQGPQNIFSQESIIKRYNEIYKEEITLE